MVVRDSDKEDPAWGMTGRPESRWPASLAALAAALLYVTLPERFTIGPTWLLPILELALVAPLTLAVPTRHARERAAHRAASIILVALVSAANVASLILLVHTLLSGGQRAGSELFFAAMQIWLTNVIVFGLWYWEFDRGGPIARAVAPTAAPDFLFPQMTAPGLAPADWKPEYVDYLYISFTNAMAFSPTDVMPLSRWTKVTMLLQSVVSLLIAVLVIARAVNILK